MKLNEFKQLIRNIVNESINETELDEMARIANLIQPGDEAALNDVKAKFKGTWVERMIDHVIANPNGSTKIELAQAAGKPRQQDVNPVVNKLLASGAFVMGGLVTPKKEKVPTSGIQGRPVKDLASLSDEQKVGRLIKQIKNYLRGVELSSGNLSPAPRQMDIDWFDQFSGGQYEGLYNVVEAYVDSPSVATEDAVAAFLTDLGFQVRKRGRPMGSAKPAIEPGAPEDMPLEEKLMMQKRAGIISEEEYRTQLEEISLSGPLGKIKDKILNSPLFNKLIDTIVSKMSDKDKAAFKSKFNISEAEGGPSLEDIMSKVDAANPDKNAKKSEELKEELDQDTFEGKIVNLIRNLTGLNLLALGGAPLGILINFILGIGSFGMGAFIGPLISLVASLIIHGISRKLLGMTSNEPLIGS